MSPAARAGDGAPATRSRARARIAAVTRSGYVDWAASARLSTARGTDEFVVRDHFAEDAVRIVVVVDRSRSMALFPDWLPWLDKQAAVREAGSDDRRERRRDERADRLRRGGALDARVVSSAAGSRAAAGDRASGSRPATPTARQTASIVRSGCSPAGRPPRPPGTFVFVLSDFLPPPSPARMREALAAGWDVVPVVVQDPVWERSFPDVSGVTLPLADPDDRTPSLSGSAARRHARGGRPTSSAPRRLDDALADARARLRSRSRAATARPCTRRSSRGPKGGALGRGAAGEQRRPPANAAAASRTRRPRGCSRSRWCSALRSRRVLVAHRRRPAALRRPALLEDPDHRQAGAVDAPPCCSAIPSRPRSTSTRTTARIAAGLGARREPTSRPIASSATRGRPGEPGRRLAPAHPDLRSQCLTRACLPPQGGARLVRVPAARRDLSRDGRDGASIVSLGAAAGLARGSRRTRVHASGRRHARRRSSREFARSPETLRTLLLAARRSCSRSRVRCSSSTALWPASFRSRRRWQRLSPLERALLQVEAAARSDDEAARRADARPARDAASSDVPSPSLEARTRALAWGHGPPEPEALTQLAEQVRATLNGGVRG